MMEKTCGNCHNSMASIAGYEYIVCKIQPLGSPGKVRLKDCEPCEEWVEAPEGWGI